MAIARLDLPTLQRELDGFKHKFDKWAEGAVATTEQTRDAHLRRVRELQGASREARPYPTTWHTLRTGPSACSSISPQRSFKLAATMRSLEQRQAELEQQVVEVEQRELADGLASLLLFHALQPAFPSSRTLT